MSRTTGGECAHDRTTHRTDDAYSSRSRTTATAQQHARKENQTRSRQTNQCESAWRHCGHLSTCQWR
jgi:hypothetical protein